MAPEAAIVVHIVVLRVVAVVRSFESVTTAAAVVVGVVAVPARVNTAR